MGTLAVVAAFLVPGLVALWVGARMERKHLHAPITHQPTYVSDDDMRALGWKPILGKPGVWEPDLDKMDEVN